MYNTYILYIYITQYIYTRQRTFENILAELRNPQTYMCKRVF